MHTQKELIDAIKGGELKWIEFYLKEKEDHPEVTFEIYDYDFGDFDFSCWLLGDIKFSNVNFRNANFQKARLIGCFFALCNFQGSNFEDANLGYYSEESGNRMEKSVYANMIVECDFTDANLKNVDFRGCVLNATNFQQADFSNSDISETLLAFADGKAIKLKGAILKGIILPNTIHSKNRIGRFTDLALAEGLENAVFDNQNILQNYLAEVFSIIHKQELDDYSPNETYSNVLLNRIKAIKLIYEAVAIPQKLIKDLSELKHEILVSIKNNPLHLKSLKGRIFEELIAELLSSYGWDVDLTKKTRDGGYDIFAISKDISGLKSSWIIECKGWQNKVSIDVVRALYGVKNDLKISNALLATTSHFSSDVIKYKASRYDLELKDYNGLIEWINQYKPKEDGTLYYTNPPHPLS